MLLVVVFSNSLLMGNNRYDVSMFDMLACGLIRNNPDEYFRFIDIIHGNNTYGI